MSHEVADQPSVSRRAALRVAAVGGVTLPLLAACGTGGGASGEGASSDGQGAGAGLPVSTVPVGGGRILADEQIVVTQPTEGEFRAFSAVCTHQGCPVSSVSDGTINCPCHGSMFSIEDGTVVEGPASSPLAKKQVTVKGTRITVS